MPAFREKLFICTIKLSFANISLHILVANCYFYIFSRYKLGFVGLDHGYFRVEALFMTSKLKIMRIKKGI